MAVDFSEFTIRLGPNGPYEPDEQNVIIVEWGEQGRMAIDSPDLVTMLSDMLSEVRRAWSVSSAP